MNQSLPKPPEGHEIKKLTFYPNYYLYYNKFRLEWRRGTRKEGTLVRASPAIHAVPIKDDSNNKVAAETMRIIDIIQDDPDLSVYDQLRLMRAILND